jgi:hypothetical protein
MEANWDQAEGAESVTLKRVLGVDAMQHVEEITSWNKRAQQKRRRRSGAKRATRQATLLIVADRC